MIWIMLLLIFIASIRGVVRGLRRCNAEGFLLGIVSVSLGWYFYGILGAIVAPFAVGVAVWLICSIVLALFY